MSHAWLLLVRNQARGFLREPAASFFNLAVPLFVVVVQVVAYGDVAVGDALPGYDVADVLPVGAAVIYVMIIGIFGAGVGLASMAEARSLSSFRLRPGGIGSLLSAYGTVLVGLVVAGLALATAILAVGWGIRAPARPAALLPVTLLACAVFVAVGAAVASASDSPRSAQGISSAMFFPLLFLSGAMFPLDAFPEGLRVVATCLPGHHVNQVLSYPWFAAQPFPAPGLVYLALLGTGAGWVAVTRFRRREDL